MIHTPLRRAAVAGVLALFPPGAAAQEPVTVLVNATIVDVERGSLVRAQTILIQGGRIRQVGPSASVRSPRGATRVDVGGRFVIPGLWDMHVHLGGNAPDATTAAEYFGSLFLANGVTGVRDAGASLERLRALDSVGRARPGQMPRLVYAGEKVGPSNAAPWSVDQARAAIGARLESGAQYIKLVPDAPMPRETFALCAAAKTRCVAHIPAADTAEWLSAPGRGSLEHLFHLAEHVSGEAASKLFADAREYETPTLVQRVLYKLRLRRKPEHPRVRLNATRDTSKYPAFFSRMATSGTWITPTLVLQHQIDRASDILPSAVDTSLSRSPLPPVSRGAEGTRIDTEAWQLSLGLVRAMHRAGVSMLAGTDFSDFHVPGASLHAELVFLQQAGVPAADVLRMATINPARYLGALDTLGTVAPGRLADLVVLRGNPLDDIRHVTEVDMVMTRGRLLRRPALDSLTSLARLSRRRLSAG